MNTVLILHLSDLQVNDQHPLSSPGPVDGFGLDELSQKIEDSWGKRSLGYIVVAGNLTAHARPEEFARADALLHRLYHRLGRQEGESAFRDRVFAVPGPSDLPGDTNSFEHFNHFMANTFGWAEGYDFDRGVVRQLKDLTFVGTAYWNRPSHGLKLPIECLSDAVRFADRKIADKQYALKTPTLLVSSERPLIGARRQTLSESYRLLCTTLASDLRVSIHLFGQGAFSGYGPEPFGFRHLGLGTGPSDESRGAWPMQANCIQLATSLMIGADDGGIKSKAVVKCMRLRGNTMEEQTLVRGEWDRLLGRGRIETPPFHKWFEGFFSELGDRIFGPLQAEDPLDRYILLRGLPGAGKMFMYQALKTTERLGIHRVQVIAETWGSEPDDGWASGRLRAMKSIAKKLDAITKSTADVILVLYDKTNSRQLRSHLNTAEVQGILNECDKEFAQIKFNEKIAARIEITTDVDGGGSTFPSGHDPIKQEYIGPRHVLDEPGLRLSTGRYLHRIPVCEDLVRKLTGSYAGFQTILLDCAAANFKREDGAIPLSATIGSELALSAAVGPEFGAEASALMFRISERSAQAGVRICLHIRDALRRMDRLDAHRDPITIDFSEPFMREDRAACEEIFDWLSKSGILEHTQQKHRYRLLVAAPFLWYARGAREYELFLSFNDALFGKMAADIAQELKAQKPPGAHVTVHCSSADTEPDGHTMIMPEIRERLKCSENLIVIFRSNGFENSGYVPEEIRSWRNHWDDSAQKAGARLLGIRIGGESDQNSPRILEPHKVIRFDEARASAKSIARNIWSLHRPIPKPAFEG